jgi:hypothetical protein
VPWLRVDDVYDTHPKILALPEVGRWRWTRGLLFCARHRTNGLLTPEAITDVGLDRYLPTLLDVALLHPAERGYVVHDWRLMNGGDLSERVAYYLTTYPGATANDVARDIPGGRQAVLAAVRRYYEDADSNGSAGGAK